MAVWVNIVMALGLTLFTFIIARVSPKYDRPRTRFLQLADILYNPKSLPGLLGRFVIELFMCRLWWIILSTFMVSPSYMLVCVVLVRLIFILLVRMLLKAQAQKQR